MRKEDPTHNGEKYQYTVGDGTNFGAPGPLFCQNIPPKAVTDDVWSLRTDDE